MVSSHRMRRAMKSIRKEAARLGFPLDDLTDEQIENGVHEFVKVAHRVGLSMREFEEQMAKVSRALQTTDEEFAAFKQRFVDRVTSGERKPGE